MVYAKCILMKKKTEKHHQCWRTDMSNLLLWEMQPDNYSVYSVSLFKVMDPLNLLCVSIKVTRSGLKNTPLVHLLFRAWPIDCKVPIDAFRASQTFQPPPMAADSHHGMPPVVWGVRRNHWKLETLFEVFCFVLKLYRNFTYRFDL